MEVEKEAVEVDEEVVGVRGEILEFEKIVEVKEEEEVEIEGRTLWRSSMRLRSRGGTLSFWSSRKRLWRLRMRS